MPSSKIRKYLTRIFRLLLWIISSVLVLLLIVIISLQFTAIQNFLTGKLTSWLSTKTDTVINIDRVAVKFPRSVGLTGIYVEDAEGDTLLYADRLFAGIRMTALLSNRVSIGRLEIGGLKGYIKREAPDSVFNFQFIADAFASDTTIREQTTENESSFEFRLNIVELDDIYILFEDHYPGLRLETTIDRLRTSLSGSDLLNSKFQTGETELTGSIINLVAFEATNPPEPPETDTTEIDLSVGPLDITELAFNFHDTEGMSINFETSLLNISPENINLNEYYIELSSFNADSLRASVVQPPKENDNETTRSPNDETTQSQNTGNAGEAPSLPDIEFDFADIMDWTIVVEEIEITNSYVSISEDGKSSTAGVFDQKNFSADNLNFFAADIYAGPDSINLEIDTLRMLISESFYLDNLALDMNLGSRSGKINMDIKTAESRIAVDFNTDAHLLDFTSASLYQQPFDLTLDHGLINDDLAFFLPEMRSYYFNWPGNQGIEFGGSVYGTMANMMTDSLWIEGPGFFTAYVNGGVAGLDSEDLFLDIDQLNVYAIPGAILNNLPDSLRPEGIVLPEFLNIDGRFSGTIEDFESGFEIQSNFGDIEFLASMSDETGQENSFKGNFYTGSFDIGRMMQMEMLTAPPSLTIDFSGQGFDPQDMELVADITAGNLDLIDHPYEDIILNLKLADSVITVTGGYSDEFLSYNLDLSAGLFTSTKFVNGGILVNYADLFQLQLTNKKLLVETDINADFTLEPAGFFNGSIIISDTSIAAGEEISRIEEILVRSDSQTDDYSFELITGFLTAEYAGNIAPSIIPGLLTEHFSDYFNSADTLPEPEGKYDYFNLNLSLYPDKLVNSLIDEMGTYDTLSATVNYNGLQHEISAIATIDDFNYSNYGLSNLQATMVSNSSTMDYRLQIDTLGFNKTKFYNFNLGGGFADKIMDISLSFENIENEDVLYIGSSVRREQDLYHISVDSDALIINRENWDIDTDNMIVTGENFLEISNFVMENQESMFSVNTLASDDFNNVIEIMFRELNIERITGFLENSIPQMGGILNGDVVVREILSEPSFIADLTIDNLSVSNDTIGSLNLTAENPNSGIYNISLTAGHEGTAVSVKGDYYAGDEPSLDFDVLLERLNVSLIESFTGGNVTHLGGFITGNMEVSGNTDNPEVNGAVEFNEIAFRVPALNAGYFLRNEKISFNGQNINLQNFNLEDSLGRTAQLNGNINFPDFENFVFNIDLTTRDFLLMDISETPDDMYHGHILMDSDLNLRGNQLNPTLRGRLRLNEGSHFTFVLPQSDPEAIGDEGVVEFVSRGDSLFLAKASAGGREEELTAPIEILDIDLNLEIDNETILRLVIDKLAGDFLEVQGGGVLSFGIDPGGDITLSGRYEIEKGEYLLTFYDFIKRNFSIESGSSILWTGDPLDAELDITAVYTLKTDVQELMRTNTGGDQALAGRLRQQFPFLVSLGMEGNLMNPDIQFGLDMPQEYQNALDGTVKQRIDEINQNESELNKQVFALLILGNFIQENPLDFSGGSGLGATARSSASQILTQQLNRLSDRYIKGLEVNFELESYEDFSEGEASGRTELQMEVSQNFFDERVRVSVGGNIELEDETQRETGAGDIAGDFSIEYLLTPEGTLIIKGFRNRDFGDLIERDVVETGVSLIFTRNYNRFRDLFRRPEEEFQIPVPDEDAENNETESP